MSKLDNAYALIIGVDNTQKEPQVISDAKAIYKLLTNEELCGYKKEHIKLLVDTKATTENIMGAIDYFIANTDENSSFLLFYSGHGGYQESKNRSFLLPFGASDDNVIFGKDLKDKLSQMKSKRMIILFDCCHSGSFFDDKDETITQNFSNNLNHHTSNLDGLAQEIDDEQGMAIVASSQKDELSWGTLGKYSLFTTCLLEALQAKNKHFFADEYIRMVETVNYLFIRVPEMARSLKDKGVKDQTPYANLQMNNDFVISYIPKKLKKNIVTDKFTAIVEKQVPISSKSENNDESWVREEGNNLLLFIHGFSGESKGTFGNIPKLLQSDSNFDGWAMKPLGYSHFVQPELGKDIWAAILDVDKIAGFLKTSICYKFKKYDRIAIIAHSMGGLVAQKAILELSEDERKRISHLIMFGTPSNGISPELLTKQWNTKYKEMSSKGPFITSLRKKWTETFKNGIPFKLKVAAATNDQYVTVESCHGPFAKEYCEFVDEDHFKMVKPKDKKDDAYNLILDTLTNNTFYNLYTNREEINITLGKYDAVVKELLPKVNDLDLNGLRQLIFSLEGLDRKDKAIKILNEHPLAKDNTDLMGILGGRYKRAYLNSYSKKEGDAAFGYYNKALELAIKAEDDSQIYYHAINLAFLSIVMEGNEGKMMKYAKQALEATNNCRDNLWKYATVAEANMYINNMDKAMEFYTKAAEMADIRQKISMHTNAYAGYVALMQTANEDDFIRFLKAKFLT
ncbi:caspase family protein [Flavobacteriaceae bacterium LMO-SS05]